MKLELCTSNLNNSLSDNQTTSKKKKKRLTINLTNMTNDKTSSFNATTKGDAATATTATGTSPPRLEKQSILRRVTNFLIFPQKET